MANAPKPDTISVKLPKSMYLRVSEQARENKRTITAHLGDILEQHFKKPAIRK